MICDLFNKEKHGDWIYFNAVCAFFFLLDVIGLTVAIVRAI